MKRFTWEELAAARERLGGDRGSDEEYWTALVADYVETIGACSRRLRGVEKGIDGLRTVKYNGGGVKEDGAVRQGWAGLDGDWCALKKRWKQFLAALFSFGVEDLMESCGKGVRSVIWIISQGGRQAVYASAFWLEPRHGALPTPWEHWELWARSIDGDAGCVGTYTTLSDAENAISCIISTIRDQGCFVDLRKSDDLAESCGRE